jgi:hypothetical protein
MQPPSDEDCPSSPLSVVISVLLGSKSRMLSYRIAVHQNFKFYLSPSFLLEANQTRLLNLNNCFIDSELFSHQ